MGIDNAYLDEKITKTKALIDAYEDAVLAISTEQLQAYTFDTGQTKQTVTKANISVLTDKIVFLEGRLSALCTRRNGSGIYVRAGF